MNELYHYGTRGQKWGIRNYQNPDGSLTSAGRIRYGVSEAVKKAPGAIQKGYEGTTKAISTGYKAGKRVVKDASKATSTIYNDGKSALRAVRRVKDPNPNSKKNTDWDVKNRRKLSDEDIQKRIERMQNEKRMKELNMELNHPVKKEFVNAGKKAATAALAGIAMYSMYELGKNAPNLIRKGEAAIYYSKPGLTRNVMSKATYKNATFENVRKNIDPKYLANFMGGGNPLKKK